MFNKVWRTDGIGMEFDGKIQQNKQNLQKFKKFAEVHGCIRIQDRTESDLEKGLEVVEKGKENDMLKGCSKKEWKEGSLKYSKIVASSFHGKFNE